MKRICSYLLAILMLYSLSACGQKTASETALTWQEQYDLGVRYLSEGNYEEAIIAFTAAIEIDPKQPDTYIGLYEAYVAVGDYESAQAAIDSGREKCGNRTEFDDVQSSLDRLFDEDSEMQMYADLEDLIEVLHSGVLTYDDLPMIFSMPFDQVGGAIGVEKGNIGTTAQSGSFRGIKYNNLELQSCSYQDESMSGCYITATAPLSRIDLLEFHVDDSNAVLNGEAISTIYTGWKNISLGDSTEEVLVKLGFDATLSKYSAIDLCISKDISESWAWLDPETLNFSGNIPINCISIHFGNTDDIDSAEYSVYFDFFDGGVLSGVCYENDRTLYDLLHNNY